MGTPKNTGVSIICGWSTAYLVHVTGAAHILPVKHNVQIVYVHMRLMMNGLLKFLEDIPLCFYANTNIHINNVKHNTVLIISHILGYRFRST